MRFLSRRDANDVKALTIWNAKRETKTKALLSFATPLAVAILESPMKIFTMRENAEVRLTTVFMGYSDARDLFFAEIAQSRRCAPSCRNVAWRLLELFGG